MQLGTPNLESFYAAWRSAKRQKKPSMNQLQFELNWLGALMQLNSQVKSQQWQPKRTVCFIATQPKTREIHAPDFADRVLHHYLVPQLEAIFESSFIYDSYANRKGKGAHKATERLSQFMRQVPSSKATPAYYLQLDIHNFFISLNRHILYAQLLKGLDKARTKQRIDSEKYQELRTLCHALVNQKAHKPTLERGNPALFAQVPAHKRLKNAAKGCGIAVGNLSSQFFSNVYMNALDQFVKHNLKARYYVRYVDDFVLVSESPQQLIHWRDKIIQFIEDELGLRLKQSSQGGLPQPQPITTGADFLGYVVYPTHNVVRRRVIKHCRQKLLAWQNNWVTSTMIAAPRLHAQDGVAVTSTEKQTTIVFPKEAKQQLLGIVASYWGHFRHASFVKLTQRLLHEFTWLRWCFQFSLTKAPLMRWGNGALTSYQKQKQFFRAQFEQADIAIQCGCSTETLKSSRAAPKAWVSIQEIGVMRSGIKRREVTCIRYVNA